MEKNDFLPYEIRKKRETLKNKLANFIIIILFFMNIVFLINLYLKELDYKNSNSLTQKTGIISEKGKVSNKANFETADTLKLICSKIKDKNYTHIEMKNKTIYLEFLNRENFERSVKDIESDSNFIVKNVMKSKDSDKYTMFIEVKNR